MGDVAAGDVVYGGVSDFRAQPATTRSRAFPVPQRTAKDKATVKKSISQQQKSLTRLFGNLNLSRMPESRGSKVASPKRPRTASPAGTRSTFDRNRDRFDALSLSNASSMKSPAGEPAHKAGRNRHPVRPPRAFAGPNARDPTRLADQMARTEASGSLTQKEGRQRQQINVMQAELLVAYANAGSPPGRHRPPRVEGPDTRGPTWLATQIEENCALTHQRKQQIAACQEELVRYRAGQGGVVPASEREQVLEQEIRITKQELQLLQQQLKQLQKSISTDTEGLTTGSTCSSNLENRSFLAEKEGEQKGEVIVAARYATTYLYKRCGRTSIVFEPVRESKGSLTTSSPTCTWVSELFGLQAACNSNSPAVVHIDQLFMLSCGGEDQLAAHIPEVFALCESLVCIFVDWVASKFLIQALARAIPARACVITWQCTPDMSLRHQYIAAFYSSFNQQKVLSIEGCHIAALSTIPKARFEFNGTSVHEVFRDWKPVLLWPLRVSTMASSSVVMEAATSIQKQFRLHHVLATKRWSRRHQQVNQTPRLLHRDMHTESHGSNGRQNVVDVSSIPPALVWDQLLPLLSRDSAWAHKILINWSFVLEQDFVVNNSVLFTQIMNDLQGLTGCEKLSLTPGSIEVRGTSDASTTTRINKRTAGVGRLTLGGVTVPVRGPGMLASISCPEEDTATLLDTIKSVLSVESGYSYHVGSASAKGLYDEHQLKHMPTEDQEGASMGAEPQSSTQIVVGGTENGVLKPIPHTQYQILSNGGRLSRNSCPSRKVWRSCQLTLIWPMHMQY